jgi:hypothetical protein
MLLFVVALSTCMLNVEELMKLGESSRGCPNTTWYLGMPHWHLCKMWEIGLWFASVEQDVHTHIRGIREKSPQQQFEVTWQWVQSLPYEGHSQKCQNVTLIPAQGSIFDYHDQRTCAISTSQGIGNCNMMACSQTLSPLWTCQNQCASVAILGEGRCIHGQISQNGCQSNAHMHSCLMDMYAKCRSLVPAQAVFLYGVVNTYLQSHVRRGWF